MNEIKISVSTDGTEYITLPVKEGFTLQEAHALITALETQAQGLDNKNDGATTKLTRET